MRFLFIFGSDLGLPLAIVCGSRADEDVMWWDRGVSVRGSFGYYVVSGIGLMRVYFVVSCAMEADCFASRDLDVVCWVNNMVCGVSWGSLNSALVCFVRRRLRLAISVSLCVIDGVVVYSLWELNVCGCDRE